MAGIGGFLGGVGQAIKGYNEADAASLQRRKALQDLSMQELKYQQEKQQQDQARKIAEARANWASGGGQIGALPGAQLIPPSMGSAPPAPQPQAPQPPMPSQASVPRAPMAAGAQPPSPVGAQPGGTGVPPAVPSPAVGPGGPAPSASLSAPGAGPPGAGGMLTPPARTWATMLQEFKQRNPGIDPMTATMAVDQQLQADKALDPELKTQVMFMNDQMRNLIQTQDLMRKLATAQDESQYRAIREQLLELQIQNAKGGGPGSMSDEAVDYWARRGRVEGMPAMGFDKDTRRRIMTRMAELDKTEGSTPEGDVARKATVKGITTALNKLIPQDAAIKSFSNTAIKNGDVLVDLAKKVDSTGIPVIDRWIRAGRQDIAGDPDVSAFNTQLHLYAAEVAKIITNPNLTGVLTDTARREAQGFLPAGANLAQIKRVNDLLKGDFERRGSSIKEEIKDLQDEIKGAPSESTEPKSAGGIPEGAPTATGPNGEKVYWDGSEWKPVQ